jgi:DNA-directed RNA polymerase subunit H (RpoH/RPB5)
MEEERAIEMLKLMLGRRGLTTTTERINSDAIDKVHLYTIGDRLIIFCTKDSILPRDVDKYVKFAETTGYKNGITIISKSEPSVNILKIVKSLSKDKVEFFHIMQLQFDIQSHSKYSPKHKILNKTELEAVMKKYNLDDTTKLPWIDSQDAQAKWLGAMPGDVIEVERSSETTGVSYYYRYCVADVTA